MGPLVTSKHLKKVKRYIDQGVDEGADLIVDGRNLKLQGYENGFFIGGSFFDNVITEMSIYKEEIFGPCCHIAPFDDEQQVINWANDTEYGLSTTVWTRDLSRAHRVAAKIDVGITWINSWFLRDLRTAFGGSKQSGIGREGGVHSLEFYTETRNVCVKL